MRLRRAEFLSLTGLNTSRFNTVAQRGQLPFDHLRGAPDMAEDDAVTAHHEARGWRWFRPMHALLWLLAERMTAEGGVTLDLASRAISNCAGSVEGEITRASAALREGGSRVYAGIAQRVPGPGAGHFVGTLAEIDAALRKDIEQCRADETFNRIIFVDLSGAIEDLRTKAKAAGISLPDDMQEW